MNNMIDEIVAAAQTAENGVFATFEVSWKFVATIQIEKMDSTDLNEDTLRQLLGEQVDELISMEDSSDAIEIESLIGIRDDVTDCLIGTPLRLRHYAVIGRIPGDDEDTCRTFTATSHVEAMEMFADVVYAERNLSEKDREQIADETGSDLGVFINQVLASDSTIDEL